jgi:hypothetical protein
MERRRDGKEGRHTMPTSLIPVMHVFVVPVKGRVCEVHLGTLWCRSAQA